MVQRLWNRLRIWLINILMSEPEKYILYYALQDRKEKIESLHIEWRWADEINTKEDIELIEKMRKHIASKNIL